MAAKVRFVVTNPRAISDIARSGEMAVALEPIADRILNEAQQDPNPEFVASLRKRLFRTSGPQGRISWQIGAHPVLGARVEAKRGTFHRIMARLGLS